MTLWFRALIEWFNHSEKNKMSTCQDLTNLQKIYHQSLRDLEVYRKEEKPHLEYDFVALTIRLELRMVINTKNP